MPCESDDSVSNGTKLFLVKHGSGQITVREAGGGMVLE